MRGIHNTLWILFIIVFTEYERTDGIQIFTADLSERTTENPHPPSIPEGYTVFPDDNVAYKIFENRTTWSEARKQCISDGGDLAIADTPEKINRIKNLRNGENGWIFVGIRRPIRPNVWIRVDNGLPVTSLPWGTTPSIDSRYYCAAISYGVKLIDLACGWSQSSICEVRVGQDTVRVSNASTSGAEFSVTTTQEPVPSGIPEGYTKLPGGNVAYKIYDDQLTWYQARNRCISDGGDLAIADTPEKIDQIKNLNSYTDKWRFVGLQRPAISQDWIRVDNGLTVTSLPWITNPPVESDYDCAATSYGLNLVDIACNWQYSSVCEIQIGEGTSLTSTTFTSEGGNGTYTFNNLAAYPIY